MTPAPKFTPGPWHVNAAGTRVESAQYQRIATPFRARMSAMHDMRVVADEEESNARLIAAAPELYEALSKIPQRYLDDMDKHTPGASHLIRAALAKVSP